MPRGQPGMTIPKKPPIKETNGLLAHLDFETARLHQGHGLIKLSNVVACQMVRVRDWIGVGCREPSRGVCDWLK